jgi:hypothetical protein
MSKIQPGDRYIKVDAPTIIWVVSNIQNVGDPVPHVRLVQEKRVNRQITLSVPTLRDTSIYKKIEAKS